MKKIIAITSFVIAFFACDAINDAAKKRNALEADLFLAQKEKQELLKDFEIAHNTKLTDWADETEEALKRVNAEIKEIKEKL